MRSRSGLPDRPTHRLTDRDRFVLCRRGIKPELGIDVRQDRPQAVPLGAVIIPVLNHYPVQPLGDIKGFFELIRCAGLESGGPCGLIDHDMQPSKTKLASGLCKNSQRL
ncbi:hypothetical protein p1B343 (plasmid) [Aromatoleum aromaticum EbN1]|uniref:Uncharacterized protein n=1 Tax=Aromatoleum aromaticum (strain DSM 19018 / LMG 30748 / EbN1) TaxID=76114 RepID=Q5NWQ8_AROAE|nr:hypothetical protein p1B343 [Aromatoleum aromaticum EbN1]